jgi:hypothetical protein
MHMQFPMASRPKSTPSLQSLLDTYHYLVRGLKGESATLSPRHATATARQMMVPSALRREMAQTLRTVPAGLGVVGLSSASVRVTERIFLLSDDMRPFAHTDEKNLVPASLEEEATQSRDNMAGWHQWLYANSDTQSVLMVHPTAAIVCATRCILPDPAGFPAAASKVGEIALVAPDVNTWGTMIHHRAILVTDGTLITHAPSLPEAIAIADIVTRWCETTLRTQDAERRN